MEEQAVSTNAVDQNDAKNETLKLEGGIKNGANWFYWIAGLSIINSIIILFQGEWSFIIGLGITQFFDGMAIGLKEEMGGASNLFHYIAFVLDLFVVAFFVLIGWLAGKRKSWAFILGMVFYFFDGLIFLLVQDWLSLGFHGFALFCIWGGFSALRKVKAIESENKTGMLDSEASFSFTA
jgi:hypothetical protein